MKQINGYELGHAADHERGHHHVGAYGTRLNQSVEYYNFYRSDTAPYFRWNKWSHVKGIIFPGIILPVLLCWSSYKFHMFQVEGLKNGRPRFTDPRLNEFLDEEYRVTL
mmetsp:Transcript_8424/g.11628  ORF Transcript_8424/g.11628 Transcript_8424/m.11628 type:complete len:109 (+) Transcript_8424:1318-1644(+)